MTKNDRRYLIGGLKEDRLGQAPHNRNAIGIVNLRLLTVLLFFCLCSVAKRM
jgi:hypothetical protein